jgi:hypothetical protein
MSTKDTIKSTYNVGDTVKVTNEHSPYVTMVGTIQRIGSAGWRTSLHLDFPNILTTRDVGENEVELVKKAEEGFTPNVANEPIRVEPGVDDIPRVIIPEPSIPDNSDIETMTSPDATIELATPGVTEPKRRGRPKGSKNKPKVEVTARKPRTTKVR